jgi:hypothetical protein
MGSGVEILVLRQAQDEDFYRKHTIKIGLILSLSKDEATHEGVI